MNRGKKADKWIKRGITFFLLIGMVTGFFLVQKQEGRVQAGTETIYDNIIGNADLIIADEAGLKAFTAAVNAGYNFSGTKVVLKNNITITSPIINPSTNDPKEFKGTFDGNGRIISNLNVSNTMYGSFICNLGSGGCVKNLGIIAAPSGINALKYGGGIVGRNYGTVENCYFRGIVLGDYKGGICGKIESGGSVKGCYASDVNIAAYSNVGTVSDNYLSNSDKATALEGLTAYVASLNSKYYYYWKVSSDGNLDFSEDKYIKPTDTPTSVPTTGPTTVPTAAPKKELVISIDYSKEEINVTGPDELYFAEAKKETEGQKIAQKQWRRAYKADGSFCIDFSKLNPQKQGFIALTSDSTVTDGKMSAEKIVKLVSTYKSVVFNLDYSQELASAEGADFLDSVEVVESGSSTKKKLDLKAADFKFEWKKGTTGTWKSMEALNLAQMESCRQTGATVYFRLSANSTSRASKMAAVKVIKQSAAPVLTADIKRNSLSLKNGMQFRVGDDGTWVTLNYYSKTGTDSKGYQIGAEYKPYDLKKKQGCTSVKYDYLTVEKIKTYLKLAGIEDTVLDSKDGFLIQMRKAPSLNRPASTISSFQVKASLEAPKIVSEASVIYNSKSKKYLVSGLDATKKYEYLIVRSDVLSGSAIDAATSKWTKLPFLATGKGVIKGTAKSSYCLKDNSSNKVTDVKISDSGSRVIFRLCGNAGKGKETFSWSSEPSNSVAAEVLPEEKDDSKK